MTGMSFPQTSAYFVVSAVLLSLFASAKVTELKVETKSKPVDCYPNAVNGDQVAVHYTGRLETGVVFDSSVQQQRDPIAFVLGEGRVIPGWEQGILGMCVGEKRLLTIPSHLAYGKKGSPPQIPPDATLIFETELMSLKHKGVEDILFKTLRFLSIPALILYVIYYLYNKYNAETKTSTSSKKNKKRK
ncbi:hypothetical protein SNE40_021726 [Patella caerulea]|uniref:peptidylprolyl isomerase n=1 Tax=Patella caerulea TaxID=87958 RepID=A0AAN8IX40_PATCE